jgi:DNA repair protein SbcC/Rad50
MIPRKLEVKNFLCYGNDTQTVDFSNHNLICLSGKNGNGKSALLDAITWALWGQARKISGATKADMGLIRLGQTRMIVCLEFECNNNVYRIRRECAKTYGKSYACLDFEIFNSENNIYKSLTDRTIRATQEKIEFLIGLDFDTFVNSAFLKQGQSNEFSKKTSKERKQILSNILGLSKYDSLAQCALEKMRAYNNKKQLLLEIQKQEIGELEKEAEIKRSLIKEKRELQESNAVIGQLEKKLFDVEQEKNDYQQLRRQRMLVDGELKHLLDKKHQRQISLLKHRTTWKEVNFSSFLLPNIKKLEQKQQFLLMEEKKIIQFKHENVSIQEQILKKKETYNALKNCIKQKQEKIILSQKLIVKENELEIKGLERLIKQQHEQFVQINKKCLSLQKELSEIRIILKTKLSNEKRLETVKRQFEKRRNFYQTFVQIGNHHKKELFELERKKTIVCCSKESSSCPLCNQSLTNRQREVLREQFFFQEAFVSRRITTIARILEKLKKILLEQYKELEEIRKKIEKSSYFITKQDELKQNLKTIFNEQMIFKKAIDSLKNRKCNILKKLQNTSKILQKSVEKDIENNDKLRSFKMDINSLEEKKSEFEFDKKKYFELQKDLKKIEVKLKSLQSNTEQLENQQKRKQKISLICQELKGLNDDILRQENQLKTLSFDRDKLINLEKKSIEIKEKLILDGKKKENKLQMVGRLENSLHHFEKIKQNQIQRNTLLKTIESEIETYLILSNTFSKNGIQALLIEEAIPEIEEIANSILAKLTNNQSQIFIESLRDLKSGGVKESLDIKISDSIGIRPYEMFSGGEAFRIDFALRIAISKLLAHRSGMALQTLIIDEGFGSQDEEGLARLMNAIHTIQYDFAKVIIVSHLPEFKDNFPTHFVINKTASGSIINIEERG